MRFMVFDAHELAARPDLAQQHVHRGPLVVIGYLVQQEVTHDPVIHRVIQVEHVGVMQ